MSSRVGPIDDFRGIFVYPQPKSGTWTLRGWDETSKGFRWENAMNVIAISSIHEIDGKPQYHVSFSDRGVRIAQGWMEALLKQWQIEDFEEDNHVPNGQVRNYWKPFDPELKECQCKQTEVPHEEEGGYVWREANGTDRVQD